MTQPLVDRSSAVDGIAAALADRTHFVIAVPPDVTYATVGRLRRANGWTAYVRNGRDLILRTGDADMIQIAVLLCPGTLAVILAPKAVAATTWSQALGSKIPADGSRDIVMVGDPDAGTFGIPRLLFGAVAKVDPVAAQALRAASVEASN